MKKILRFSLLFAFSLATANLILSNLIFGQIPLDLIIVAFILAIFEIILKPIIKILLIPINILTLGLLRTVINTLGLYLATFLVANFQIKNISLPSQNYFGFITPQLKFDNFLAYFVSSLVISLIFNFFRSILTKTIKT